MPRATAQARFSYDCPMPCYDLVFDPPERWEIDDIAGAEGLEVLVLGASVSFRDDALLADVALPRIDRNDGRASCRANDLLDLFGVEGHTATRIDEHRPAATTTTPIEDHTIRGESIGPTDLVPLESAASPRQPGAKDRPLANRRPDRGLGPHPTRMGALPVICYSIR